MAYLWIVNSSVQRILGNYFSMVLVIVVDMSNATTLYDSCFGTERKANQTRHFSEVHRLMVNVDIKNKYRETVSILYQE